MFVIYTSPLGMEVIITTVEREHETLKDYFIEGGRDLEEYDREEATDCAVVLEPGIKVTC